MMESLLTSEEVAEHLRVEVVTVRRLVNRGELAAYRVGGEYRFTRPDVEAYLQRQRIPATPANDSPNMFTQLVQWLFPKGQPSRLQESERHFTKRALKTLHLAQEEAQRLQHNYIGTEHLLLGLVREGEGIAAQVLGELRCDLEEARNKVIF